MAAFRVSGSAGESLSKTAKITRRFSGGTDARTPTKLPWRPVAKKRIAALFLTPNSFSGSVSARLAPGWIDRSSKRKRSKARRQSALDSADVKLSSVTVLALAKVLPPASLVACAALNQVSKESMRRRPLAKFSALARKRPPYCMRRFGLEFGSATAFIAVISSTPAVWA